MTDFFDSDIVRNEAKEMEFLQMKAMELTLAGPMQGSKEDQLEYIKVVRSLVEKQQIFYTRLRLSDDPRAQEMVRSIEEGAKMLYGWYETSDVISLMREMLEKLDQFEKEIEAEG
jgi:tRNA G26 N,N-dimethylase Trm1